MKLIGKIYYWIRDTIRRIRCKHEYVLVYEFRIGNEYIERKYRCRKCGCRKITKKGKKRGKWR